MWQTRALALRAHHDYGPFDINVEPLTNEGNFRAKLRLKIKSGDEELKKHFETCAKNATYISWRIQNEIICASHSIICKKIIDEVKESEFYSVLGDETLDSSNKLQFSFSLRYLNK